MKNIFIIYKDYNNKNSNLQKDNNIFYLKNKI